MTILATIATTFGIISSVANAPQVYKIFKRKSAKDISIITYSFLCLGAIAWILYGIELKNWPLIITNTLGGINIFGVIVGWMLYGK